MKNRIAGIGLVFAVLALGSCFIDGSPQIVVRGPVSVGDAAAPLEGGETINFGTVGPNGATQDLSFTIQNVGTAMLQLIDTNGQYVHIETDDSGGLFSIPTQPTSDTLDPDDAMTFVLRFTSDGTSNFYTATIEIRSDDPQDPSLEFTLSAEASPTAP